MAKKIIFTIFSLIITTIMASAQSKFTLVIDAGHGGHDVGAKGAFSYEKDINLKVSLAFGKYVEKYCQDVKVVYTRKTDVFIPLHERADIANKAKANLFISVHTNALPKGRIARGFESYTLGMHRAKDNLDVAQRENSVILVEKDYKTRYEGFDPNSSESYIMFEFIQDKNMAKSVNFATLVQNEVCNGANRPNKGVKQAGFLVLRETTMPSCLIELGFITTPDEEQLLNNEQRIDEISRAIFNAFQQYKKKETGGSVAPLKVSKPEFSVNTPVTSSANTSRTQNNNSNVSSSNKGDNASGNQQKTGTQQQARNSNSQVQNAPEKKSTSVVPRNTQEERRKANEQAKKKAEEEARKKVADNAKKKAIEDNKKKEEAKKEADKAKNKTASDTKKATPEIKNQGNAASKNTTKKNKDADDVKPRAQMKREQTNKGLASNATKNKEIPNNVSTSASTSMTSVQSQRQTTQRQTTQQTAQQRNNTTTATTQTQRSAVVTQNSTPSQQGTVSTAKPNQQLAQSEQKKAETVTVRSTEAATNTKTEPVIQQTQAKPQNSVQASKPSETPQKKIASVATTQNAQQNQPVVPAKKETTPAKIETGNNVAKTTPQQPQKTEAAVQKADVQAKSNETETSMPVFKVQVVASREQLKADDARLMGEKDFSYYEEGDFYKYTIGNSTNYDEMGKTRQSLLDKFPGAFIVAFKDGKKINTAEAVREFRQNKK